MINEAGRLIRFGQATPTDVLLAMFELGLARLRLDSRSARAMIAAPPTSNNRLAPNQAALVDRVAFVIPRVAARLPWRADCLVQAMAAQHWLETSGIGSTIHFGVRREKQPDFEAHAWLTVGERIVTGGEIEDYVPLTQKR